MTAEHPNPTEEKRILEFPGGKITLTDSGRIKVEFQGWWAEADPLTEEPPSFSPNFDERNGLK